MGEEAAERRFFAVTTTEKLWQSHHASTSGRVFNVYCDESGHLENEHNLTMVLGAVWCPLEKSREIAVRIREIKQKHDVKPGFEVKWKKVSRTKKQLYLDLIDYFFDDDDLHFRTLVVPDKSKLRHDAFEQDHNTWYYKMYFNLLKVLLDPEYGYRIYLDIKDTRSAGKTAKLHEVLANSQYDFSREIIQSVQNVRSHEVEMVQLADLLIGAVSYANRGLSGNEGKESLTERIRQRSHYSMTKNTLYREDKFNVFVWRPSEAHA